MSIYIFVRLKFTNMFFSLHFQLDHLFLSFLFVSYQLFMSDEQKIQMEEKKPLNFLERFVFNKSIHNTLFLNPDELSLKARTVRKSRIVINFQTGLIKLMIE